METTYVPDVIPFELMEKLDITVLGDATQAIVRALSVIERLDPRKYVAFVAYYGFKGFASTPPNEIGEGMGISSKAVLAHIETVERLVDEEVRALGWTRVFPDAYGSWPLEDFFTMSRALANKVSFASATRIRTFARKERSDFPTVRDLTKLTENGLTQIPGTGVAMVRGIKKMLRSAHLKLATH